MSWRSSEDQARLAEQIELGLPQEGELESLAGLWADGEPLPSLEEMQAARQELWGSLGDKEMA